MKNLLVIFCFLCFSKQMLAQDNLQNVFFLDSNAVQYIEIPNSALFMAKDQENSTDFAKITSLNFQKISEVERKNFENGLELGNYWFKTQISNRFDKDFERILVIGESNLIDVYLQYPDGKVLLKKTGANLHIDLRDIFENANCVEVFLPKNEIVQVFVQISSPKKLVKPSFRLLNKKAFFQRVDHHVHAQIFFQACFLIMMLYNFLLFFTSKDKTYLYYVFYIAVSTIMVSITATPQISFLGKLLPYREPIEIFMVLNIGNFYLLFTRSFTEIPKLFPRLDHWLKVFMKAKVLEVIFIYVLLLSNYSENFYDKVADTFVLFDILVGIVMLGFVLTLKNSLNYYLGVGSIALFLGGGLGTLGSMGLLPNMEYAFPIGLLCEIVIFSYALSYKTKLSEAEKRKIQADLIEQLRTNEEMQQNANRDLEQKVKQRTIEIANKNEELEQQSEQLILQKNELQKAYTHITDSVRYAKRIQTALLPQNAKIQAVIPNSFIIFRPKDIVSGDFYFFFENPNFQIIAVADCTGHGVPGAFMTVIGNNILSQLLIENQGFTPAELLTLLDKRLLQTLQQQNQKEKINDGMDVALIKIEGQKMTYSSAKRPIFQFRNQMLIEHEPSKFPIGSSQFTEKIFDLQSLEILKNDIFYLFTDGYVDQFGGSENRKYMTKNFKKLLQEIHLLPLEEQKNILEQSFDTWKSKYKQTDDVLVMGIRF